MKNRAGYQEKVLSTLTIITTFLMGFVDAYTFSERGGTFASAQTGNMVSFSAKLFTGQWSEAAGHISVFLGFAIGAYAGEAVIQKSRATGLHKYRIFILIQMILLLILAIFQGSMGDSLMVFFLGLLAGYELTTFRSFRGTTINNGIMTGNTKNLMNNLYIAIHKKDKVARKNWMHLAFAIFVFILGAGVGALILKVHTAWNLWALFIINVFLWFWLKIEQKRFTDPETNGQ